MSELVVALAVAAVVVCALIAIGWPFVSTDPESPEQALSPLDRRRLELLEARDEAYTGLRDLEQDHRTGKITDEDYRSERRRLRAQAARVIEELDSLDSPAGDHPERSREV